MILNNSCDQLLAGNKRLANRKELRKGTLRKVIVALEDFVILLRDNVLEVWTARKFAANTIFLVPETTELKDFTSQCIQEYSLDNY